MSIKAIKFRFCCAELTPQVVVPAPQLELRLPVYAKKPAGR